MKKAILIIACFVTAVFGLSFNAQAQQQQQQQPAVIIKPAMPVDYLVFASNALQTIEIQGSEVDAFLACQQTLNNEVQKCVDQKKTLQDQITFDIRADVAQTIVNFLTRAKLTGADAVKYKGFLTSLNDAAIRYQNQNKK